MKLLAALSNWRQRRLERKLQGLHEAFEHWETADATDEQWLQQRHEEIAQLEARVSRATAPVVALLALALTGCALTPETRRAELLWQSANLIDGVQTSQYGVNDCREVGTWRAITGPEPSVGRTALAAGINGLLHFAVTWALERSDAPPRLQRAWHYTTFGLTAGQVAYNASLGCD